MFDFVSCIANKVLQIVNNCKIEKRVRLYLSKKGQARSYLLLPFGYCNYKSSFVSGLFLQLMKMAKAYGCADTKTASFFRLEYCL